MIAHNINFWKSQNFNLFNIQNRKQLKPTRLFRIQLFQLEAEFVFSTSTYQEMI